MWDIGHHESLLILSPRFAWTQENSQGYSFDLPPFVSLEGKGEITKILVAPDD